jgi:TfoX/Sxy family transcriptional regulator of competence genes
MCYKVSGGAAMAYDEKTAARIRKVLEKRGDLVEKKMFGGLCFMVKDQMCVGLTKDALMVRVGPDAFEESLAQPHARPMDFTGRPMVGFVFVDPPGYATSATLARWLKRGVDYVETRPPKKKTTKAKAARRAFPKRPAKRR